MWHSSICRFSLRLLCIGLFPAPTPRLWLRRRRSPRKRRRGRLRKSSCVSSSVLLLPVDFPVSSGLSPCELSRGPLRAGPLSSSLVLAPLYGLAVFEAELFRHAFGSGNLERPVKHDSVVTGRRRQSACRVDGFVRSTAHAAAGRARSSVGVVHELVVEDVDLNATILDFQFARGAFDFGLFAVGGHRSCSHVDYHRVVVGTDVAASAKE